MLVTSREGMLENTETAIEDGEEGADREITDISSEGEEGVSRSVS